VLRTYRLLTTGRPAGGQPLTAAGEKIKKNPSFILLMDKSMKTWSFLSSGQAVEADEVLMRFRA
jgi:hypothetical protein